MPVKLKGIEQVRRKFAQLSRDFESYPKSNNPLKDWEKEYGVRGAKSKRPTIAKAGTYRGNRWPGLAFQYKRKTDGVVVPVWGGVKRAVFGRFAQSRLGVVTRAGSAGIRVGESRRDKALGHGVIKVGQLVGRGGNVLGKLNSQHKRYKRSDLQLAKARRGGLFQDWFTHPGKLSTNGKRLTKTTNKPHAARIAAKRPFHWGRTIARVERHHLELVAAKWLSTRIRRRA